MTSNTPTNTPTDALRASLVGHGMSVYTMWALTHPVLRVRLGGYHCEVARETLLECVEIHWPFGKPLSDLAMALMIFAHTGVGLRPAYPQRVISEQGKGLPRAILAQARQAREPVLPLEEP